MSDELEKQDLIGLLPDNDMEAFVRAVLSRPQALGIPPLRFVIRRHPERDSGCFHAGVEYLRLFSDAFDHALLILDHHGSGREKERPEELEKQLESQMARSGWGDRAAAIVIEPELEMWLWGSHSHVAEELGWRGRKPELESWLSEKGFLGAGLSKPLAPKEALKAALRQVRKPRSSALYHNIGGRVSLARCEDRAFLKFRKVLSDWFTKEGE